MWFLEPKYKPKKKTDMEVYLTAKASSALWLSEVSSGLSTGVCLVNLVSNWLTSSSDCYSDTGGKAEATRYVLLKVYVHMKVRENVPTNSERFGNMKETYNSWWLRVKLVK